MSRAIGGAYASGSFEKYELCRASFVLPRASLITTGRTVNPGYFIVVKATSIGRSLRVHVSAAKLAFYFGNCAAGT